jgi:uncharacterized protein YodC (DUF2158 family)
MSDRHRERPPREHDLAVPSYGATAYRHDRRLPHAREAARPFRPGDEVRLGEGGLLMQVVELLSTGCVRVAWTSGDERFTGTFERDRLVRV